MLAFQALSYRACFRFTWVSRSNTFRGRPVRGAPHGHDALDGLCSAGGAGASASPPRGLRLSGATTVKRRSQCLSIQCCNIRSSGKVGTRQIFSLLLYFCSLAQSIVQFVCDSLFDENERILKFISSLQCS